MIRNSVKNYIFQRLNYDIFRTEDFDIFEEKTDNSYIINITYDSYYFKVEFPLDNHSNYIVEYCPGRFIAECAERTERGDLAFLNQAIPKWMSMLRAEVMNPLERRFFDGELQNFKEQLNSKLDKMDDSYFSKAEGEELKERLKILEDMIQNNSEEASEEIEKIGREIELLKTTIDSSTKKKWIKSALTKIWAWGQKPENQKLIESGFNAVKAISQVEIPDIKS